jgi:hypothetical protein
VQVAVVEWSKIEKTRKVFELVFWTFFLRVMSGLDLLHRQRSPQDLQESLAWYKIRDTLLGGNEIRETSFS